MATLMSLRDADQRFVRRICAAEGGEEFVIARHGTPVARLVPAGDTSVLSASRTAALDGDPSIWRGRADLLAKRLLEA